MREYGTEEVRERERGTRGCRNVEARECRESGKSGVRECGARGSYGKLNPEVAPKMVQSEFSTFGRAQVKEGRLL
jgi:hypothetical protein